MKKTGLALGGGVVLGAAHIGVLNTLEEEQIEVSYIAGTSIGAFVAALFAFGKSWQEIKDIAIGISWSDITKISLSKYGLLSNRKLKDIITEHIGEKNIEEAIIPLAIIATDVTRGEKVVLKQGPVVDAIMASTCMPGIFKPVEYNGKLLVDGGIVENVPINTVHEMGADFIIAVDLNAKHTYDKPGNILDIISNSFHFIMQTSAKLQTENADLLIQPNLSEFNRKDMKQIEAIINKGYNDSQVAFEKYRENKKLINRVKNLFASDKTDK